MRILYIEDDIIDQMAFKRFAEKKEIDLTIAKSKTEAISILENNSFEFIFSDYYLGDGTAQEILQLLNNQRIGIFADENKCIDVNQSNDIVYFNKPLTESQFETIQHTKLDLTYFNSLTENDNDFKKEILTIALQTLPVSIENINKAVSEKDLEKIKFEAHKMKSGARVVGINIIEELEYIEHHVLHEDELTIFNRINKALKNANIGLIQIHNLLEQLEKI